MKTHSIAGRIFQIVLAGNLVVLLVVLVTAWWALEGLEQTFIDSQKAIELEYFEQYGEKDQPSRVQTAQMISAFQPANIKEPMELPIMFRKLPVPFEGEVKLQGKEYLAITHQFPEGTWYLAKSLEAFELQEERVIHFITLLAGIMLVFSLLLAWLASRLIARPVVRFSQNIKTLETANLDTRMQEDFVDNELNTIAKAINIQLMKIEDMFQRERALIAMASHELRTPIAVISGAVNVLENRNQLQDNDRVTLERISKACSEMSDNIHALLNLVRQTREETPIETINLQALLEGLRQEYGWVNEHFSQRLTINTASNAIVQSDSVLVRILLHNIINNALNHAIGRVTVTIFPQHIEIADEGSQTNEISITSHNINQFEHSTGMGMYIVNLICDALHWHYTIATNSKAGITVNISFRPA